MVNKSADELKCVECGCSKRMHSMMGCTTSERSSWFNCTCQVKFTQRDKFK